MHDIKQDLAIYTLTYMILNGEMDYLSTQTLAYLITLGDKS